MGKNAKRQHHDDDDDDEAATTKHNAPAEKRLPAEERSFSGKENSPLNSQDRGDREEEEEAGQLKAGQLDLDKFGFCLEDGHRYADGTRPEDFPPADPDFDMRNESLGVFTPSGLEFFGRYVLLRGRNQNGKLYSKPTLFLIKEEKGGEGEGGGEGNYEIFSLPDDLTFGLRDFIETVGKQIMGLVWRKSKRI